MALSPAVEQKARPEDRFISAFEMQDGHTLNGSNTALQGLRKEAIAHFAALGLPTRKDEAWKYTNIEKVLRHEYQLQLGPPEATLSEQDLAAFLIPDLDAHVLVLVNGRFDAARSAVGDLPAGVIVSSLAEASASHADLLNRHFAHYADHRTEVFTALNTAFTQDGFFIYVPKGKMLEKPVHVLHVIRTDRDLFIQPRNLIVAEEGAAVRVIETGHALTEAKTFTNAVTEIFVGARAHVDHYQVQDDGPQASQVSNVQVYQQGDSVFSNSTVTLGGEVVRNNTNILPDAERCESHLYGLFLGRGRMHVDNHTFVDHAKPNCFSNELYKGILDDASTGVFNGKVYVRRDAQQTNAYQSNKAIVLTEKASMYSKPELEIYADDVKCSHGATTGQLDRDAIFYLMARGIPERKARAILLLAFARDVIENLGVDPLREMLDAQIAARFER